MAELNLNDNIQSVTIGDIISSFSTDDLNKNIPFIMEGLDGSVRDYVDAYKTFLSNGDYEGAATYRSEHPKLETRIFDVYKANTLAGRIAYLYLYAKAQIGQIVVGSNEPKNLSISQDESNFDGQENGDIWLNGTDDCKMNLKINGEYKNASISPIVADKSDILEINFDKNVESSLTNPHRLITLSDLNTYDERKLSTGIEYQKYHNFTRFYESYKMKIAEAHQKTHENLEVPEDFMNFVQSGLLPEEEIQNYKSMINSFIGSQFYNIPNKQLKAIADKSKITSGYSFISNDIKYAELIKGNEYRCYVPLYEEFAILSYVKIKCCYKLTTNLYTDSTMTKHYNSGKNDSEYISDSPYEFKGYYYKSPGVQSNPYNMLVMDAKNAITQDSCYFTYMDDEYYNYRGAFTIRVMNDEYIVKEQMDKYFQVKTYKFYLANEMDTNILY